MKCVSGKKWNLLVTFFRCSFTRRCWGKIHILYSHHISVHQAIVDIKAKLLVPFTMDIIIHMTLAIWKQRNDWIFNRTDPSVDSCYLDFKGFFDLFLFRLISKKHFASAEIWRAPLLLICNSLLVLIFLFPFTFLIYPPSRGFSPSCFFQKIEGFNPHIPLHYPCSPTST